MKLILMTMALAGLPFSVLASEPADSVTEHSARHQTSHPPAMEQDPRGPFALEHPPSRHTIDPSPGTPGLGTPPLACYAACIETCHEEFRDLPSTLGKCVEGCVAICNRSHS